MPNRNPGDIQALVDRIGIKVSSVFVPFSQSRNASEKHRSLNWKVTLYTLSPLDGQRRDILTTDYSAGEAHCPSYKQSDTSMLRGNQVAAECETGKAALTRKPINPDHLDVLYSLVSDSDVLNWSSFEEWANDFGYDSDSRAAEKIYTACMAIALKLRNGIGDAALSELRDAFADY